jgi:PIN domain nuclease of toxin-antitoxin system
MRDILIDTHILIWWLSSPEKIKQKHLDLIANPDNAIYVSIASFFEISLKIKKGKIKFDADFAETLHQSNFNNLPIELSHLSILQNRTFPNQDPFDMLIISQAFSENMELISYDESFREIADLKLHY